MLLVAACGYRQGTLYAVDPHGHAASIQRLGCLDVAVVPVVDNVAKGAVAGYRFANRCDRPIVVDFRAVRVTGIYADGRSRRMAVYDPEREVRRGTLDARSQGRDTAAGRGRHERRCA